MAPRARAWIWSYPLWHSGEVVTTRRPSSQPVAATLQRWSSAGWAALGELTRDGREDHGWSTRASETDLRRVAARLARPALWGLVSTIAIVYGASQFGSPFALKVTGAWFFGIPSITTPPGRNMLLSLVASYGGMLLLIRAWMDMIKEVSPSRTDDRPIPVAALGVVAALWCIPLLIGPPLFSQDVYSYAAQGVMVTKGINPYHHGPDALGVSNPYYPFVDQLWGASPAPYGPVFMILDAAIVTLSGHHVLGTVIGLRLLAVLGVALMGIFLPKLASCFGRDPGTVFVLAVLNPVTLLDLVASGHNDALMLGLLVAGLYLAVRRRRLWAIVLCTLAAAVKAPAAIGLVYIGWGWLGPGVPWRERVRPMMTTGLMAGAVAGVVTAASGLGWDWVKALDNPSVVRSVLDPVTALGMLLGSLCHLVGLPVHVGLTLHITRTLGMLAAMAGCAWLLIVSDRIGMVKAIGASLLLVVLLGPVIQPWYVAWGIIVLAPVAFGRWRTLVVFSTVVGSFIGFPGGWQLLDGLRSASVWSMAGALIILLSIPLPPVIKRLRQVVNLRPDAPAPALAD